jgi:hypothetical protein
MKNFMRKIITRIILDPDVAFERIKKRSWQENNAFRWAAAYAIKNQIIGDYLEFGVWRGNSFIEMYNQIQDYSKKFYDKKKMESYGLTNQFNRMKFHAFDSFEGLPETENKNNPVQYFKGNYSSCENFFKKRIIDEGLDNKRVTVTKGWFNETLNDETAQKINLSKISIVYIDCDLYEGALSSLNFITSYLQRGTILIFDDWFRNMGDPTKGVQGSVIKWLSQNKHITLQHYYSCDTRTILCIVQLNQNIDLSSINHI